MNSLYHRINQSPNADLWRRFRMSAEDFVMFSAIAEGLGFDIRAHTSGRKGVESVEIFDDARALCVIEPSGLAPSPLARDAEGYAIAFTEHAEAIRDYTMWTGRVAPESDSPGADDEVSPLILLLQREERSAWLDLEREILETLQSLNQLDLENEPLFLNLGRCIRDLLAPDLLELHLESPTDFWPGRTTEWSWIEAVPGICEEPVILTPRLQRLLYRKERALFVEDLTAAPDIHPDENDSHFASAFLLPFSCGAKPLGILKLMYTQRLAPLPGEVEAVELFRRELGAQLDRSRTHLLMQRMATVDGLTNLFNHRFFREQLRTEFQRAIRYEKMMAVIMIDIDDFKGYNDTYGHLAGDRVLAETARAIRGSVRDIDFVARYGGEEFALILPEVDAESGLIVAEKIRRAVESQRFISDDSEAIGSITVSCGVTDNLNAPTPEEMLQRADRALYWVKRHGRNFVRLATDDNE